MKFLVRIAFLTILILSSAWKLSTCAAAFPDESTAIAQAATQGSADSRPAENLVKASVQSGSTGDAQINRAVASMGRRSGIIWADYSANQTWATCPNWG